jgi:hypothetical protein
MVEKEAPPLADLVIKPCWRAFVIFYVYIFTFLIGPWIDPNLFWGLGFLFSVVVGTVLGLILIALVLYLKMGQEYRITARGVATVRHWPSPRQQLITWENLGSIGVNQGVIQMLLRVGNLLFRDKSKGALMRGPIMVWNALSYPQEVKKVIEGRRP